MPFGQAAAKKNYDADLVIEEISKWEEETKRVCFSKQSPFNKLERERSIIVNTLR